MRILLISDVHANWPALQALKEPHDICLCLGDLVDYGLEPAPCIDWVKRKTLHTVRGNHDHGVAQNVTATGLRGFGYLTAVTRPLTRQRLGPQELQYLARLPVRRWVTLDDTRILLVHASPRDPLDEYAPADVEFWSRLLPAIDADIVCVGHTHHPYVLEVGNKIVINPGSVGLPRDGDPRGAYAILDKRKVELRRFEYPVEDVVRVVRESPMVDQAKELLIQVYRGKTAS